MMRVLVTGGTGSLGLALVRAAMGAEHMVRVMSRRPRPASVPAGVEWAQSDVLSDVGLRDALEQVGAVLHAASDPRRAQAVDVGGARRLVEAARVAGVAHLVSISIVGIDDIPLAYYKRKREAEQIVESGGVPYTILRATQFHSFVHGFITKAARVPLVMPLTTDFKFQSITESEVAERLVACLGAGPRGRVADLGGPEVLSRGATAQIWMEVVDTRKRLLRLPIPGAVAAAFRAGKNTVPEGIRGVTPWREWLRGYGRRSPTRLRCRSIVTVYRLRNPWPMMPPT